jgi:environmental stress-induced protein Ves
VTSPSAPPERLALAAIAAQPWKNGAGLTRELAVEPRAAGTTDFHWRISIAEVDRDAPFSAFPGIDRCITLLRGAGMRLASTDGSFEHRLDRVLAPFSFPGDLALDATLLGGACSDFNVMTRRGAWRAEVGAWRRAFESGADADALLLLCIGGEWQIEAGATDHDASWPVTPDHALLWRGPCSALWATPQRSDSTLLVVQLCHDRAR